MKTLILVIVAFVVLVIASVATFALRSLRDIDAAKAAAAPAGAPPTAADVEAFLAPHRDALAATRRPMHRITLDAFPADEPLASKVGGRAWWPAAEAAPTAANGVALVLLAQVNFAEVPATAGYPARGLLQVFIAPDDYYGANFDGKGVEALVEQRNFRVVFWPDPALPGRALAVAPHDGRTPHAPDQPRRMHFTAGDEALSLGDYRFDRLFGGNAYDNGLAFAGARSVDPDKLLEAVAERHGGTGHKLGGYPFFTQADPRSGGDWELLLQLDSDDDMMWGDSGVANFFIAPANLARGDFSRVLYHWDCY